MSNISVYKEASLQVASCLRALGRERNAEEYLGNALNIQKLALKKSHPSIVLCMVRHACIMAATIIDRTTPETTKSKVACFGSRNFAMSLRPTNIFITEMVNIVGSQIGFGAFDENRLQTFLKATGIIKSAIALVKNRISTLENADYLELLMLQTGDGGLCRPSSSSSGEEIAEGAEPEPEPEAEGDEDAGKVVINRAKLQLANICLAQTALFSVLQHHDKSIFYLTEALDIVKCSGDPDTRFVL